MWRKIHSNRDPKDTLYREIRKEFSAGFDKFEVIAGDVFSRYPKFIFRAMVALLLASMVLSLTVLRQHPPAVKIVRRQKENPVSDGFSQLLQTTAKIKETIRLKEVVDSISARKQLTGADSAALDSALSRLQLLAKKR